ncbi:MAG: hypothetical protein A3J79_01180 [Elusimicrobia bacterium RIFOXYB2_FULL_62_6]|nr:MAG: hypothetical protein A3J79_01180 [Elusimicrobia bacterium RIFOXYB2_FULL_62_6]
MKLTVVVTVYNEKATIIRAIQAAKDLAVDKEIIVVDNCSTDGTRELLRSLNDPAVQVVYQPVNYGYGMSVITGIKMAKGEFLFVHNSDLEYDPACVYEMLDRSEKEGLDAVFGSRLFNRRKKESVLSILKERPFYLGTVITTGLANIFYGRDFTDVIGNRFYRTASVRKIDPQTQGIGFDFEVVSKLCKYGMKLAEVPVTYASRTVGKKIKVYDIIPAVLIMFRIKFLGF